MTNLQRLLTGKNGEYLTKLAAEIGVDRVTVYRWRAGKVRPGAQTAAALIQHFKGELDHNGIYQDAEHD